MRQLVELNKNLDKFPNTKIVAISADNLSRTQGLSKRIGATFPMVSDPGDEISAQWAADIKGAALYFVRPDGTIHYGYTDPINSLDRPPLDMVVALAAEAADPKSSPRKSEFDAPCRPSKGVWICDTDR